MERTEENPRLPADGGLAGLGLIMQLAGGTFAAMTAMTGALQLLATTQFPRAGHGRGWLLAITAFGVIRALVHRAAGTEVLYGARPREAVRRYVWLGLAHAATWGAYLKLGEKLPSSFAATAVLLFAAWPIALAVRVPRSAAGRLDEPLAPAPDRGYDGLGVLMAVLGSCGLVYGLVLGAAFTHVEGSKDTMYVLLVLTLLMMAYRSIVHLRAAFLTLVRRDLDVTAAATVAYGNTGVVTGVVATGAILLFAIKLHAPVLQTLALTLGLGAVFVAWPLAARRFVQDRRYLGDARDVADTAQRSPDRGLTTLGWLLLALGAVSVATALPRLVFGASPDAGAGALAFGFGTWEPDVSPWLDAAVAGLELWAGAELCGMTPRYRIAASAYGAVAAAVTIYASLPVLRHLGALERLGAAAGPDAALGMLCLALVLPVATLLLANQRLPPVVAPQQLERVFG